MKISFGMIFSIILIIAFLAFGVYAIKYFLDIQDKASVGVFIQTLQSDIDKTWQAQQASKPATYSLPGKLDAVCFINAEEENLVFLPPRTADVNFVNISHIDIIKTVTGEGWEVVNGAKALCFEKDKKNKVTIVMQKDFGEKLVTIVKPEEN